MEILVGYTGFVGSNICRQHNFSDLYNSKNISCAYGHNPDLCVYTGIYAEKYIANAFPDKDSEMIAQAIDNIVRINPKRVILISTVDVYKLSINVDENTIIDTEYLQPYGLNRYKLERWVINNFEDSLVVRLPALFGQNLKKNFIYDLINLIPSMLTEEKYSNLSLQNELMTQCYKKEDNGFYKLLNISESDRKNLRNFFSSAGFSALNFTDSRAVFQFYNLDYLWGHINIALSNDIKLINLVTEPISADEIYKAARNGVFKNETKKPFPQYNIKTIHSELLGGKNGYIFDKSHILRDIEDFARAEIK